MAINNNIIAVKTIILTNKAAKELDALPTKARATIDNALVAYATRGIGDIKRLQGTAGFRLRVGEYRVLFSEDQITILAVYIGRRSTTMYKGI